MELNVLIWVVLSVLVGFIWKKLNLSLVSGIVWSLVLSPIVGMVIGIVLFLIKKNKNDSKTSSNN